MIRPADNHTAGKKAIRCAIYTRKSTDEGLDKEFNSLDAQRETGVSFVASRKHEGWTCLPDHFDDGGFSGGTLDRPALNRLICDIKSGKIDVVICYKVDRLSRSILDFARLVELFDKNGVSLVSVTQPFNTSDSAGRLMMNVLLSFAEYERQIIRERTSNRMSAARRKGRWMGGTLMLGYDLSTVDHKLVVNKDEADQVRAIFSLYLEKRSLTEVAKELNSRCWRSKSWIIQNDTVREGRPFTKANLHRLLSNPLYVGRIRHKDTTYKGEQDAIVDEAIFQQTQAMLRKNGSTGGAIVRNKYGFLLRGLLHCAACGRAMTPHTTRKGQRIYKYYRCSGRHNGARACPTRSISAGRMERFVVGKIKDIGKDPALVQETLHQVMEAKRAKKDALVAEQKRMKRDLAKKQKEARRLLDVVTSGKVNSPTLTDRLAELEEHAQALEERLSEIARELDTLSKQTFNKSDLATALSLFDPIWDVLYPLEQARIIQLLIERIDYDSRAGKLVIEFRPTGIRTLASEIDEAKEVTV